MNSCKNTTSNTGFLIFIGILTMTIEHIGLIFFPDQKVWQVIDKLAFPILAFLIAEGMQQTSNVKQYQKRLLVFALLAQLPFMWAFNTTELNILFTFLLSTSLMIAVRNRNWVVIILCISLGIFIPLNYGLYGVLFPLMLYFWKNDDDKLVSGFILLNTAYTHELGFIQWLSIVGLVLCYFQYSFRFQVNRWLFYGYYPIHLLLLLVMERVFEG
ncbi:TraX family protein [Peribacillus asahii]|uniref:TraX family protein n=1 Tax=Peribacillus asahii TaxID=228899 RepID=UPI00207ABE05|nr:TraX family protein [Peribacillus asahii]USK62290.1 conjugal transfer protein TraX [Peribacillus asahii]